MRHVVAGLRALAGDLADFSHSLLLDIGTAALGQGRIGPANAGYLEWPENRRYTRGGARIRAEFPFRFNAQRSSALNVVPLMYRQAASISLCRKRG
jgi:hypothetical protein